VGKLRRQQQQLGLGVERDFAVRASVYGKVQTGPTATLYGQERRRRRRRGLLVLLELDCLANYRLCVTYVHLPILGWYPPHHTSSCSSRRGRPNNSCITASCPRPAARASGVRLPESLKSRSTPSFASNSSITALCPCATAYDSTVRPSSSLQFTLRSACFITSSCTAALCPSATASPGRAGPCSSRRGRPVYLCVGYRKLFTRSDKEDRSRLSCFSRFASKSLAFCSSNRQKLQ
jgi:hypothetical protein